MNVLQPLMSLTCFCRRSSYPSAPTPPALTRQPLIFRPLMSIVLLLSLTCRCMPKISNLRRFHILRVLRESPRGLLSCRYLFHVDNDDDDDDDDDLLLATCLRISVSNRFDWPIVLGVWFCSFTSVKLCGHRHVRQNRALRPSGRRIVSGCAASKLRLRSHYAVLSSKMRNSRGCVWTGAVCICSWCIGRCLEQQFCNSSHTR